MIERFYDPQAGEVLIDDINLREFQLKWIRQKVELVSQEPVLFTSSIKDNIAYGMDEATTEEIRAATELANAAKFIDKPPQVYDDFFSASPFRTYANVSLILRNTWLYFYALVPLFVAI